MLIFAESFKVLIFISKPVTGLSHFELVENIQHSLQSRPTVKLPLLAVDERRRV